MSNLTPPTTFCRNFTAKLNDLKEKSGTLQNLLNDYRKTGKGETEDEIREKLSTF